MNRLITIAPSHYCEKARWALRLAGVEYKEEPHLPFFHAYYVKKAGGQRSTPALWTPDDTLSDSSDILQWIQGLADSRWKPYGEEPERAVEIDLWERWMSQRLGDSTRRVAYFYLMPNAPLTQKSLGSGVPSVEQRWLPRLFSAMRWVMRRSMRIDHKNTERSIAKIHEIFDGVEELLKNNAEKGYLFGEFSAADLSFATLAAPVLLPSGYLSQIPKIEELPEAGQTIIRDFQERKAGQFALRIYEELEQRNSSVR